MKSYCLLLVVTLVFLFGCKASQPTGPTPSGSGASVYQVTQTLDTAYSKFYNLAQANLSSTPGQVLLMTAAWIQTLPNVQTVSAIDSLNLDIQLTSGLHTIFSFVIAGSDSLALTRGGSPIKNPAIKGVRSGSSILSTNKISNKNVLIYCPFLAPNDFGTSLYRQDDVDALANIFRNSGLGFNVTVSRGSSLSDVNSFGNYGLVFIETHGLPFGFYSGVAITSPSLYPDSITGKSTDTLTEAELQAYIDHQLTGGYELIQKGVLSFGLIKGSFLTPGFTNWQHFLKPPSNRYAGQDWDIIIRSEYLQTLPQMTNTIFLGNFCYSGWAKMSMATVGGLEIQIRNPIATAFENLQPISYYCYGNNGLSNTVDNNYAKAMEDSLSIALVVNGDSTGHAYINSIGQSGDPPFEHFGADDYSYSKCGDTLVDPRDGQKYATVCIGDQVWMAQNLSYNPSGSSCPEFYAGNCTACPGGASGSCYYEGRLYPWDVLMNGASATNASPSGVQGLCPKGWHIPSDAEFQKLASALGGMNVAGGAMKDTDISQYWNPPNIGATNSSGFNALPTGNGVYSRSDSTWTYLGLGLFTSFWTTTMSASDTGYRINYGLSSANAALNNSTDERSQYFALPCRCIKDP